MREDNRHMVILQSKNAGELLRLYMQHDMVEEAVELSKEYLTAFTGTGHETFGLKARPRICYA